MRIHCPHCGERDSREFTYLGDASVRRPNSLAPNALEQFTSYIYLRDNPGGLHRELWYHAPCQACLVLNRDTRSHKIAEVESLKARALGSGDPAS
jgi:heterotetrameric sarcosine oxidase delta subunit